MERNGDETLSIDTTLCPNCFQKFWHLLWFLQPLVVATHGRPSDVNVDLMNCYSYSGVDASPMASNM
jgi:hypothetical protein